MAKPKMQLVFVDPIRWRDVKKELPTKKTPYAGKYAIQVLAFDLDEFIDSGSCNPAHISYDFKKKQFLSLAYGNKGTTWIQANVTHWMPLPPIPAIKENAEESRTAVSPHGFRYFRGADKLAKEFLKMGENKK